MGAYQIFFDGMALGFMLGFIAFYAIYRSRVRRLRRPKDDVDRLIEEFQAYYRKVSEEENQEPYE